MISKLAIENQLPLCVSKTQFVIAIRASDPVRARAADMLIKGEGGPADPKRAVSLLSSWRASDVPGVKGALGLLYIEGKLVPRDLKKA